MLRETFEEVGLRLQPGDLIWSRSFPGSVDATWMFATRQPEGAADHLRLGQEAQELRLMRPDEYLTHPRNVPHFAERLRLFLTESGGFS